MSLRRSRQILIICASVILLGYLYHAYRLAAPQPKWGLHAAADFISMEDYLPVSAGKIDQILALTREGHLMGTPAWLTAADFLFPLLLLVATYRYVQGSSGRTWLAALYLIPVAWGLLVLQVEWSWLPRYYAYLRSGLPDTYSGYVVRPWIIRSVLPKAVLILNALAALWALYRSKKAGADV